MQGNKHQVKNKGGRPRHPVKRNQFIGVRCSYIEKITIEEHAKVLNQSSSEYLRILGLKGQLGSKIKVLPKEILEFSGTLNHIAANLNQIVHHCNKEEGFNALDKTQLHYWISELKNLVQTIKSVYQ